MQEPMQDDDLMFDVIEGEPLPSHEETPERPLTDEEMRDALKRHCPEW